jgi:hypothetical protein
MALAIHFRWRSDDLPSTTSSKGLSSGIPVTLSAISQASPSSSLFGSFLRACLTFLILSSPCRHRPRPDRRRRSTSRLRPRSQRATPIHLQDPPRRRSYQDQTGQQRTTSAQGTWTGSAPSQQPRRHAAGDGSCVRDGGRCWRSEDGGGSELGHQLELGNANGRALGRRSIVFGTEEDHEEDTEDSLGVSALPLLLFLAADPVQMLIKGSIRSIVCLFRLPRSTRTVSRILSTRSSGRIRGSPSPSTTYVFLPFELVVFIKLIRL